MTSFADSTLAVTGAGGHLGRSVVEHLLAGGARKVVALTRSPDKLADLAGRGVEVRKASFADPAGLPAAFAGVERLLIISTDDATQRLPQQIGAVDAAVKAGVGYIAYTGVTSPYPSLDPDALVPNSHYWTEVRIAASGVDFGFLRNNQYTDYLIPGAQHAVATGTLYHASGIVGRAYVTREDCAAAAAAALLKAEGKRVFDIGGPAAVTMDELAALLQQLTDKPVVAQNVPGPGLEAGLLQGGVPAELAAVLTRFDTDAATGLLAIVSNAVEVLTGRKPQSVADFLAANKAALSA